MLILQELPVGKLAPSRYSVCPLFSRVVFSPQALQLADGKILSSRLIIDAMGNFSPVVKQVKSTITPFSHSFIYIIVCF